MVTKYLRILDRNILMIMTVLLIVIIPLYPKFPSIRVYDTYIAVRLEDFYVALVGIVFAIQALRRKVIWDRRLVILFVSFWSVAMISVLYNVFISKVIFFQNIALLHALRRVEYMLPFLVAFSAVKTELEWTKEKDAIARVMTRYLSVTVWVVIAVCAYALGQKTSLLFQPVRDTLEWMSVNSYGAVKTIALVLFRFFDFPAVQTMNAEFAKGHLLNLTPESRVSSTFAGHYDLAAFLAFLLPILAATISFARSRAHLIRNVVAYLLSILILILTASRASFGAFIFSISLYFSFNRKWKGLALTALVTVVFMMANRDMTNRFMDMFQKKRVFENVNTGTEIINQDILKTELPAGSQFVVQTNVAPIVSEKDRKDLERQLVKKELEEARKSGKVLTEDEAMRIVQEKYKEFQNFVAKDVIAGDTSLATRTQVEWPRAWKAFFSNPLLGTGPSSLTESTDGDYFRWLGEMGLLGAGLFIGILVLIWSRIYRGIRRYPEYAVLLVGFCAGMIALAVNATLIDVFEASKVAYVFWTVAGVYMGVFGSSTLRPRHDEKIA